MASLAVVHLRENFFWGFIVLYFFGYGPPSSATADGRAVSADVRAGWADVRAPRLSCLSFVAATDVRVAAVALLGVPYFIFLP